MLISRTGRVFIGIFTPNKPFYESGLMPKWSIGPLDLIRSLRLAHLDYNAKSQAEQTAVDNLPTTTQAKNQRRRYIYN